jgi:Zn-dependent metalloprotease
MRQFRLNQQLKQQPVAETSQVVNENETKVAPNVNASEPAKKQPETKSSTSKKVESATAQDQAPIEKGSKKHIRVKTSASQVRVPTDGSNTIVLHCDPHVTEVKINVSAAKQHFDMKNSRLYKKKPVVTPSTEPAYHKVPVADKLSTEELEYAACFSGDIMPVIVPITHLFFGFSFFQEAFSGSFGPPTILEIPTRA